MARKILLADDSVTAQNMGRKILADAGYDVITVNNGSAALKRIAEIKPDLIVLDVYMPGYSGLEVCQRLKDAAETAHVPVLLTVGKLEPFKPEEARRVRADGHIVKPFEASELLTAITRLEDRMVPQQSDGGRFSTSVSGVERFGGDGSGWKTAGNPEAETGWKSRLRFPSKKKQEEPEPEAEDAAAGATFRDFRKAKGKTGASGVFAVKAPVPPGQEPGLVPEIPRDITPEELDALSALAEKLNGPIPAAENIAPLAEDMVPVEAPAAEVAAAKEVGVSAAAQEKEKEEIETPALVVETTRAAVEAPASAAETPVLAVEETVEEKSDIAIAVEHTEPASGVAAVIPDPATVAAVEMNSTLLAQEPAPVDGDDEPMFASGASAVDREETEEEELEEVEAVEAVAKSEAGAPPEAVTAKGLESKPVELKEEDSQAEELKEDLKAAHTAQPVRFATSVPETAEAVTEEPTPSDAQLAEALRLLTPATGRADDSTVPSHGTLVAAGQFLAEEVVRKAASTPQWIAEPVTLSPEEAAISLEAEMFGTFAAKPATMSAAASGGEIETARVTVVSAIAAAVENRLAEAGMAASSEAWAEKRAEYGLAGHDPEIPVEAADEETPAEVLAAVSNAASSLVAGIDLGKPEPGEIEPEKIEAEEQDSPAKVAEESPADMVGRDEVKAAPASMAEENRDSSSDAGGQESMGNEGKDKSAKSSWRQIHTAPASAPAPRDVEEAKQQADPEVAGSVKTMAAAAAAEGATSAPATDASEIASIVDTMLAELKPKLMQEIAKKLAKK